MKAAGHQHRGHCESCGQDMHEALEAERERAHQSGYNDGREYSLARDVARGEEITRLRGALEALDMAHGPELSCYCAACELVRAALLNHPGEVR